ncbi:MAG: efflux RND transporter periplasmic adaptor subunit [Planctomycetes bacterium]|nr:efflux RND transporter periplasmic adaptor subunit [Planctomycetota bacterium]
MNMPLVGRPWSRVLLTLVLALAGPFLLNPLGPDTARGDDPGLLWAAPSDDGNEEIEYEFFCAMHPQVVSEEPGKCPLCGMPFSKRPKAGAMVGEEELPEVPVVQLSPRQIRLAGVKTEPVAYRHLVKTIHTVGTITYDERLLAYVTSWIVGRVDKLFVDFTGVAVKKGEPLVWIYSPDLVSAQQEYLLSLETRDKMKGSTLETMVESANSLVEASRDRLLLWGITEEQIEELSQTGKVQDHMTIYAPESGTVIKKDVLKGQYVKEGSMMYTIADLAHLWMMADIYEYEMGLIKLGQDVEITTAAFPGQTFAGEVTFIEPFLNEVTRSLKVRVDVPNPDLELKPAMFVNATFKIPLGKPDQKGTAEVLSIPRSAVLYTGLRELVYVEMEKGLFEAREIKTGYDSEGYVEVLEGLKEDDVVVTRGAFLLDAESQLGPGVGVQYYGAMGGPEEGEKGKEEKTPPPEAHRH